MRLVVVVAVVAVVALAGCSFDPGAPTKQPDAEVVDDTSVIDAPMIDAPIDAMPDARVCPAAPAGCVQFTCAGSTSCYYTCGSSTSSSGRRPWRDARDACEPMLGCIVTIDSQAEHDCIAQQTLPVYPNTVWFGFRQSSSGNEPADGWAWECGTSTYAPAAWGTTEPNNLGGDEDCGALTTGGGWFDANCDDDMRYVCEIR